jgi:hypothetical protein
MNAYLLKAVLSPAISESVKSLADFASFSLPDVALGPLVSFGNSVLR